MISFIILGIVLIILIQNIFIPKYKIEKAEEFLRNEDYSEAKKFYEEANGFGNSKERIDILKAREKIKCGKVEIAYDFSGGEIGESKSLMFDRTL